MNDVILSAIKDAADYLDVVADDRGNAYIDYSRQEEVVKILYDFLALDKQPKLIRRKP